MCATINESGTAESLQRLQSSFFGMNPDKHKLQTRAFIIGGSDENASPVADSNGIRPPEKAVSAVLFVLM